MSEFHQTVYGRNFFESQLPTLIKSIQQVAEAIKAANEINAAMLEEIKRRNENNR